MPHMNLSARTLTRHKIPMKKLKPAIVAFALLVAPVPKT